MKRYLIIHVGCLECGIPTRIIGWNDTVPKGALLVTWGVEDWDDWPMQERWHGEAVIVALDTESIPA